MDEKGRVKGKSKGVNGHVTRVAPHRKWFQKGILKKDSV